MPALPGYGPQARKSPHPSGGELRAPSLRHFTSWRAWQRRKPPADSSAARGPTRRFPAGGQGGPSKKRRRLPRSRYDRTRPRGTAPQPKVSPAPSPSSRENGKRGFPSLERRPDTCHLCRAPRTHPAARLPEEGEHPNNGELGCRGREGREKRKGARR